MTVSPRTKIAVAGYALILLPGWAPIPFKTKPAQQ